MGRVLGLVGLLLVACAATPPAAQSSPTASPAPSSTETLAPIATASPSRSPTAFPDLPLVAVTTSGALERYAGGSWVIESQLCDGRSDRRATTLEALNDGRQLFGVCAGSAVGDAELDLVLYDVAAKTKRALGTVKGLGIGAASPDATRVVVRAEGDCPMPAPVCQTRAYLHDTQTGADAPLLPSDYWLRIEFRWTPVGLTYFVPYCAEAGCPGAERSGTYSYSFSTHLWSKVSSDRLVFANGVDRGVWERRQSLFEAAESRVVEIYKGQERILTAANVKQEIAVALLSDGRVLAWRPDEPGRYAGVIVTYRDGREERTTPGQFSDYLVTNAGDIVLSAALIGAPAWVIYSYSAATNTFATMTPNIALERLAVVAH